MRRAGYGLGHAGRKSCLMLAAVSMACSVSRIQSHAAVSGQDELESDIGS